MTPLERAYRRTFQSFTTRNFRIYVIGQVISGTGSWVQFAAQYWLVKEITHGNGLAIGATPALQFAPVLLLGAWGGVVVDRLDKRKLLITTQSAAGLLSLVLGILALLGVVELWMVYLLAVCSGSVMVFDNPGRRAFVPELVPPENMANAVALNSSVFTVARIIGPATAGLIIAGVDIEWCFMLNAVSFIAAIWTFVLIRPSELRPSVPVPRARHQLREGFEYAWRNRPVRVSLLLTAFIGTFAFNYPVVMTGMASHEFGGNAATYGFLMAFIGIGSLAGALWSAHFGRASLRITILSCIGLGVATMFATLAPTLATEFTVLIAVGLGGMVMITMATAVCNEVTAPQFRGRVMALFSIAFLGSTPIGSPIVGWVMDEFGSRAGLGVGGASALIAGIVALTYQRRHLHVQVPLESGDLALAHQAAAVS
jgi:MFS family permease